MSIVQTKQTIRVEGFPDDDDSSLLLNPLVEYLHRRILANDAKVILCNCHAGQNCSPLVVIHLMAYLCYEELEAMRCGDEPLFYTALRKVASCFDTSINLADPSTWPKFCMKEWTQQMIWPRQGRRSHNRWPKGKSIFHEDWLCVPMESYTFYIASKEILSNECAEVDMHVDLCPATSEPLFPYLETVDARQLWNTWSFEPHPSKEYPIVEERSRGAPPQDLLTDDCNGASYPMYTHIN